MSDKLMNALAGLIPQDIQEKVTTIIEAALEEARADLDKEYDAKLQEAYATVEAKRAEDWKVTETGYQQAHEVIEDLRHRLEVQAEEFKQTLDENYEKAYEMLVEERNKNQDLSDTLYKEFREREDEAKEFMVVRVDEFLTKMADEYYDMARREVLNDPCLAEHRVAFEKVVDVVGNFLAEEDVMLKTNSKVEDLSRMLEQNRKQMQTLESKNTRLMTENNQMKEYMRQAKELIEETRLNEQHERVEKARNVEGRGKVIAEPEREVVIGESTDRGTTTNSQNAQDGRGTILNKKPATIVEQWQYLADIK